MIIAIANTISNNNVKASPFDPDATAFFSRVTAAGGTLTTTEKDAVDTLVKSMKAIGTWTSMKAIYPMVGASAAACAQNLKSSSFTGTFTSGWTFASTGVTPNGTSAYMNTGFAPSTNLTANNSSIGYYGGTTGTSIKCAMGATSIGFTSLFEIYPAYTGLGLFGDIFDGSATSTPNTNAAGFIFAYRTSSSTQKKHSIRGTITTLSENTNASAISSNVSLAARNVNGSIQDYSNFQHRFSFMGDGLTDTQAANFYTVVQNFQTTLGRQIDPVDPDASAFFSRVTAAGGTLTTTEQTAVDTLVKSMKATGTWTGMKAIYPMVGGSAAACAQNLKSSSFTGTFTSGWAFSSLGVTGNGSSAYMNTGFIPSTNLSDNSTHASLYLNTNNAPVSADPIDFGSFNSVSQALTFGMSNTTLSIVSRNLAVVVISAVQPTRAGFGITTKTSATVTTLYKNGVSVASGNSGGILPLFDCYLATLNLNGTPYSAGYANNRIAFHSIGDALDATQATNLYNSVQTFQTTLSRQV